MTTDNLSLAQQLDEAMSELTEFFSEYEHLKLIKTTNHTLHLFPGSADDITDLEDYLLLHVIVEDSKVVVYATVYCDPTDNDFKFESSSETIKWFTGKNICFADCEDGYNALFVLTDFDQIDPVTGNQITTIE